MMIDFAETIGCTFRRKVTLHVTSFEASVPIDDSFHIHYFFCKNMKFSRHKSILARLKWLQCARAIPAFVGIKPLRC